MIYFTTLFVILTIKDKRRSYGEAVPARQAPRGGKISRKINISEKSDFLL
jgi:hypothetical protein